NSTWNCSTSPATATSCAVGTGWRSPNRLRRMVAFTKGHGTGNDFVILADPDGLLDLTDVQIAALCDRHFGIGADGVLRVVRSSALPDGAAALAEEPDAEWFMDYRNAD